MAPALTAANIKPDGAVDERKQSVVTPYANIIARVKARAPLSDQDIACPHNLPAIAFDSKPFRLGIAPVMSAATCFLVRHLRNPRYLLMLLIDAC